MDVLQNYLDKYSDTEFEWGKFDCTTFAIQYIDELCGTNLFETSVKGHYDDLRTAKAYALSSGEEWLYVERELPTEEVMVGTLERGDIICYSYDCWSPIAIMVDDYKVAVVTIKNGLQIVPLHNLQGIQKIIRIVEVESCQQH